MPKTIIAEGKTTQEAIEKGLMELGVSKNQVEIKTLESKRKSFFNILEPHVVRVEITVKENEKIRKVDEAENYSIADDADLDKAKENINNFLNVFLKEISEKITFKTIIEKGIIYVEIEGDESSSLIGYRGESLNSLQVILSNIANKKLDKKIKVILDIGNYKDTRKKTLEELALKIEKTVLKTGKQITLEPMTAYERKIIHTKLQSSNSVKTYSIGEGDKRRIVISKK